MHHQVVLLEIEPTFHYNDPRMPTEPNGSLIATLICLDSSGPFPLPKDNTKIPLLPTFNHLHRTPQFHSIPFYYGTLSSEQSPDHIPDLPSIFRMDVECNRDNDLPPQLGSHQEEVRIFSDIGSDVAVGVQTEDALTKRITYHLARRESLGQQSETEPKKTKPR
jgi:hypothetical protein